MSKTKWFVVSLAVSGLTAWTTAFAQANADEREVKVEKEVKIEQPGSDVKIEEETKITEEGMTQDRGMQTDESAMRRSDIAGDSQLQPQHQFDPGARELRAWANQPRGSFEQGPRFERQAGAPPATQPMVQAAPRRELLNDADVFLFEEGGPQGYWTGQRGQIYGFRGESDSMRQSQIYGFSDSGRAQGGVQGAVIHPTPSDDASSSWSKGRNLVDDNLIQNRDEFEVDRDFYTKEWKVSGPPLVAHPRFHTIYDDEFTSQYYTSWHGAPVLWSANAMTYTAMPQTRNQPLSDRQMVTYWDSWKDDNNISNVPVTFGSATGAATRAEGMAFRDYQSDVYGYVGPNQASQMTRDGVILSSGQALFWDDQDLLQSNTVGLSSDTYGFVSPEGGSFVGTSLGGDVTGDLHLNIPRDMAVSIYGVPGGGGATETVRAEPIYGYVGEEREVKTERKVKVEKKTKHKDKECDDDEVDDLNDMDDDDDD